MGPPVVWVVAVWALRAERSLAPGMASSTAGQQ
jgi:hypothetical protein